MDVWQALQEEEKKYKGTLVLATFEICFLHGVMDGDDDYYWILEPWRGKKYLHSAVGSPVFLIDTLDQKTYEELVRVWNLNNDNQAR